MRKMLFRGGKKHKVFCALPFEGFLIDFLHPVASCWELRDSLDFRANETFRRRCSFRDVSKWKSEPRTTGQSEGVDKKSRPVATRNCKVTTPSAVAARARILSRESRFHVVNTLGLYVAIDLPTEALIHMYTYIVALCAIANLTVD